MYRPTLWTLLVRLQESHDAHGARAVAHEKHARGGGGGGGGGGFRRRSGGVKGCLPVGLTHLLLDEGDPEGLTRLVRVGEVLTNYLQYM